MRFRLLSCALVTCGAVLTAGCGGGTGGANGGYSAGTTRTGSARSSAAKSGEAVTRPTGQWVAGYCSTVLELFVFLVDSRDSTLEGFLTPADAGRDLTFRTGIFAAEVNRLGRPDTPHGNEGKSTIRELAARERVSAARIVEGTAGNPSKAPLAARKRLVHDEVNGSLRAITETTSKLGHDDPAVGKAIEAAADCDDLAADMRKHYPSSKG